MKPDPLHVLLRLRERELDDLRRELADALAAEGAAEAGLAAAERAIEAETRVAAASNNDGDVEHFGRWLIRARGRRRATEQALVSAAAATAAKRAELSLAAAAAEATAKAIAQREALERQLAGGRHSGNRTRSDFGADE